ncbi:MULTISPECIES: hypothetical protein [Frankia]|nr:MULTISPECIES: hypothetical protein [Frankia]
MARWRGRRRPAAVPSGSALIASRAAVTAQSTGLYRAAAAIQPGSRHAR